MELKGQNENLLLILSEKESELCNIKKLYENKIILLKYYFLSKNN